MPHAGLTLDQQREVLQHLRSGNKIKAVLAVRTFTGLGLKEAIAALDTFGLDDLYAENHMGMTSDILAIGPFSAAVVDHMEYPAKFYADARQGAPIIRTLFEVLCDTGFKFYFRPNG